MVYIKHFHSPEDAEKLLNILEASAANAGLHVNAKKTEYVTFNVNGDIRSLNQTLLKLVEVHSLFLKGCRSKNHKSLGSAGQTSHNLEFKSTRKNEARFLPCHSRINVNLRLVNLSLLQTLPF